MYSTFLLCRFAIVFFPLKYKYSVSNKKVYAWNTVCWLAVFGMTVPVAVNHGFRTETFLVYSTHNTTTVCQGRYWFMVGTVVYCVFIEAVCNLC